MLSKNTRSTTNYRVKSGKLLTSGNYWSFVLNKQGSKLVVWTLIKPIINKGIHCAFEMFDVYVALTSWAFRLLILNLRSVDADAMKC